MIRKILFIFIVILVLITMFFMIDYNRAKKDLAPLFAWRAALYKDGGTSVYYGLGYKVIDYNKVDGRKDVVFQSPFVTKGKE